MRRPADPSALEPDVRDGRTRRAHRTREAIVDACITLVDEGDLKPTAPRIAERASVSVRSIFQHFDDLESLFAAVADRLVERLAFLFLPVASELPLADRLDQLVLQRTRLLEAITPIRRAAAVHGPFSREITARLHDAQTYLRSQVEEVLHAELAALAPARRGDVLDQLDIALSWGVWDGLRSGRGHAEDAARRIVRELVDAVLAHAA